MPDEALTNKEVVALLKLAEKAVHAMAQAGGIAAFKSHSRIERTDLDHWIDAKLHDGDGGGRVA